MLFKKRIALAVLLNCIIRVPTQASYSKFEGDSITSIVPFLIHGLQIPPIFLTSHVIPYFVLLKAPIK